MLHLQISTSSNASSKKLLIIFLTFRSSEIMASFSVSQNNPSCWKENYFPQYPVICDFNYVSFRIRFLSFLLIWLAKRSIFLPKIIHILLVFILTFQFRHFHNWFSQCLSYIRCLISSNKFLFHFWISFMGFHESIFKRIIVLICVV